MCVSFTEGSSDDCLQGHPDGSGLQHCRLTSVEPEPWPAGRLLMQAKISIIYLCINDVVSSIVTDYLYICFFFLFHATVPLCILMVVLFVSVVIHLLMECASQ